MRHLHLPTCLMLLFPLLHGCSSPPGPRTPDGASRTSVNNLEAIERYQYQQRPSPPSTPTQQRILQLEQQVEALRRQLAALQQPIVGANRSKRPQSALTVVDGVEIEVLPDRTVLRFPQAPGQAGFAPSAGIAALLRNGAAQATRIAVRGRTDAVRPDPANKRLAAQRAALARQYMLDNGAAPSKIRSSYQAAGDRIADNATLAGRARNRRIEIELAGLATPPLATAVKDGSTP
ncbi:OmpA family protein [Duganella sp. FT134W]|uniref:OmpA family protein n=1 Tax=Duganella margarita TaxID=2692170 RepID=A0A7X4KHY6_9BURK|nr:OmpA family protein [Duganella margarita]MYM73945.1 OmpA family protein [Duganella margarita]